jgi:phenylpyruvate tautomerase PptA (4-oxalocrotonate tautomerase family)
MQLRIRECSDTERSTALRRYKMALISCDMRQGRTDEQKRMLAAGLLRVISEAAGEPKQNTFFVIREGRGINGFVATFGVGARVICERAQFTSQAAT